MLWYIIFGINCKNIMSVLEKKYKYTGVCAQYFHPYHVFTFPKPLKTISTSNQGK